MKYTILQKAAADPVELLFKEGNACSSRSRVSRFSIFDELTLQGRRSWKIMTVCSLVVLFGLNGQIWAKNVYYVDALAGNNSNNGTSTATA